jgi:hypothetical protein
VELEQQQLHNEHLRGDISIYLSVELFLIESDFILPFPLEMKMFAFKLAKTAPVLVTPETLDEAPHLPPQINGDIVRSVHRYWFGLACLCLFIP